MKVVGNLLTLRQRFLQSLFLLFVGLFASAAVASPLQAVTFAPELDVTVSANVNDTILRIKGYAAPNSFITVLNDGIPIGTITANADGTFDKAFPSQSAGLHTIQLYAKVGDQTTDTVTEHISLQAQSETTLTVFLPTTLVLSAAQVTQGDEITFSGVTSPHSSVTLLLDNNLSFSATAAGDGRWSITVPTSGFYIGMHYAYAVAYHQTGIQSIPTSQRPFQVRERTASEEPSPSQPPSPDRIEPPIITKPQNNFHTSRPFTQVCGLARANSQVEIWEDNAVVGSVFANHQGEWCLDFYFSKSRHELVARACLNALCSNFSASVVIYFDALETLAPFLLSLSDYRFAMVYADNPVSFDIIFKDGVPPYEINISWGNEVIEKLSADKDRVPVHLAYQAAGHYSGVVTAKDSKGRVQARYFSVLVVERPSNWPWILAGAVLAVVIIGGVYYWARRKHQSTSRPQ